MMFADVRRIIQEMIRSSERPKSQMIRIIEGFETVTFRSKFDTWAQVTNTTVSEDGRGRVAGEYYFKYVLSADMLSLLNVSFGVICSTFATARGECERANESCST